MRTPDDRSTRTPRQRLVRMLVLAGVLLVAVLFARKMPKDQTVHYDLGDAAPRVTELQVHWAPGIASNDWTLGEDYHFELGQAPRVVTHVPRLADGDYTVELDVRGEHGDAVVRKHVTLSGGSTLIDLAASIP